MSSALYSAYGECHSALTWLSIWGTSLCIDLTQHVGSFILHWLDSAYGESHSALTWLIMGTSLCVDLTQHMGNFILHWLDSAYGECHSADLTNHGNFILHWLDSAYGELHSALTWLSIWGTSFSIDLTQHTLEKCWAVCIESLNT